MQSVVSSWWGQILPMSLGKPIKRTERVSCLSLFHGSITNNKITHLNDYLIIISKMRKLMHCLEHIDKLVDSSAEKVKTTENQRLAEVELFASTAAFQRTGPRGALDTGTLWTWSLMSEDWFIEDCSSQKIHLLKNQIKNSMMTTYNFGGNKLMSLDQPLETCQLKTSLPFISVSVSYL